jgi:hypothetical protein
MHASRGSARGGAIATHSYAMIMHACTMQQSLQQQTLPHAAPTMRQPESFFQAHLHLPLLLKP